MYIYCVYVYIRICLQYTYVHLHIFTYTYNMNPLVIDRANASSTRGGVLSARHRQGLSTTRGDICIYAYAHICRHAYYGHNFVMMGASVDSSPLVPGRHILSEDTRKRLRGAGIPFFGRVAHRHTPRPMDMPL
jgi:hypothetical protein